jgi:hypothetical protein
MKAVYRTISFWVCIVGFFVNLPLLFVARHLGNRDLQQLHLLTMLAFVVGAGSYWYLDRVTSSRKK